MTKQINSPKMEASNHRTNQVPHTTRLRKMLLKQAHRKNWQHKREAHSCSPIMQLSRGEATIIFRLRTGHCKLRAHRRWMNQSISLCVTATARNLTKPQRSFERNALCGRARETTTGQDWPPQRPTSGVQPRTWRQQSNSLRPPDYSSNHSSWTQRRRRGRRCIPTEGQLVFPQWYEQFINKV